MKYCRQKFIFKVKSKIFKTFLVLQVHSKGSDLLSVSTAAQRKLQPRDFCLKNDWFMEATCKRNRDIIGQKDHKNIINQYQEH